MRELWHSKSVEETQALAATFSQRLVAGGCVALQGELGSGKTCFAKGLIAKLSGVPIEDIPSPTFTLVEEYPSTKGRIYHVDLYRMKDATEAEDLAWDEMLAPGAVTLVEWPERLGKIMPYCQFRLIFSREGEQERRIELHEKESRNVQS